MIKVVNIEPLNIGMGQMANKLAYKIIQPDIIGESEITAWIEFRKDTPDYNGDSEQDSGVPVNEMSSGNVQVPISNTGITWSAFKTGVFSAILAKYNLLIEEV